MLKTLKEQTNHLVKFNPFGVSGPLLRRKPWKDSELGMIRKPFKDSGPVLKRNPLSLSAPGMNRKPFKDSES